MRSMLPLILPVSSAILAHARPLPTPIIMNIMGHPTPEINLMAIAKKLEHPLTKSFHAMLNYRNPWDPNKETNRMAQSRENTISYMDIDGGMPWAKSNPDSDAMLQMLVQQRHQMRIGQLVEARAIRVDTNTGEMFYVEDGRPFTFENWDLLTLMGKDNGIKGTDRMEDTSYEKYIRGDLDVRDTQTFWGQPLPKEADSDFDSYFVPMVEEALPPTNAARDMAPYDPRAHDESRKFDIYFLPESEQAPYPGPSLVPDPGAIRAPFLAEVEAIAQFPAPTPELSPAPTRSRMAEDPFAVLGTIMRTGSKAEMEAAMQEMDMLLEMRMLPPLEPVPSGLPLPEFEQGSIPAASVHEGVEPVQAFADVGGKEVMPKKTAGQVGNSGPQTQVMAIQLALDSAPEFTPEPIPVPAEGPYELECYQPPPQPEPYPEPMQMPSPASVPAPAPASHLAPVPIIEPTTVDYQPGYKFYKPQPHPEPYSQPIPISKPVPGPGPAPASVPVTEPSAPTEYQPGYKFYYPASGPPPQPPTFTVPVFYSKPLVRTSLRDANPAIAYWRKRLAFASALNDAERGAPQYQ